MFFDSINLVNWFWFVTVGNIEAKLEHFNKELNIIKQMAINNGYQVEIIGGILKILKEIILLTKVNIFRQNQWEICLVFNEIRDPFII